MLGGGAGLNPKDNENQYKMATDLRWSLALTRTSALVWAFAPKRPEALERASPIQTPPQWAQSDQKPWRNLNLGGTFSRGGSLSHLGTLSLRRTLSLCRTRSLGWATVVTATLAEEFSQSIQDPSYTHPGTAHPVRTTPHAD